MTLVLGKLPEGRTLDGNAVLSFSGKQNMLKAIESAAPNSFLVVQDKQAHIDAEMLTAFSRKKLACLIVHGTLVMDEALQKDCQLPVYAQNTVTSSTEPDATALRVAPSRMELSDRFVIKPGYVMLADIDGFMGFSPTKFAILLRGGNLKSKQESGAAQRNLSRAHPHNLPNGGVASDRFYEPFVHAHIEQISYLETGRGWAKMALPHSTPEAWRMESGEAVPLKEGETVSGVPNKLLPDNGEPISVEIKEANGSVTTIKGINNRALFNVASAIEKRQQVTVAANGELVTG